MSEQPLSKAEFKIEKVSNENFFFNENQELILSEDEVKKLEKNLCNFKTEEENKLFFKSAYKLYKKLEEKNFVISLEELEKE